MSGEAPRLAGSVNERLHFCRVLLERAGREEERVARVALEESALLQLHLAYRVYLQELAFQWRLAAADTTASALRRRLREEGRDAAELQELEALERGGWLAAMLEAAAALESPRAASRGLIAADRALAELCGEWRQALESLVARQRELVQEW